MDESSDTPGPTRRTLLATAGLAGVGALAGCLGSGSDDESGPDPISVDDGRTCDVCTMEIGMQPGTIGQAFYDDAADLPEEREEDEPAWFCSGRCTYTYLLDGDRSADPTAAYVTDYSEVEWSVDDGPTISAHPESEAFAGVEGVTYVVASEVAGAMGASMVGFTESEDAESFAEEYGGERYDHGEIDRDVVDSLSM